MCVKTAEEAEAILKAYTQAGFFFFFPRLCDEQANSPALVTVFQVNRMFFSDTKACPFASDAPAWVGM